MAELTNKQKVFIDNYLVSLNATDAAIKAGYSKKSARHIAAINLTKPLVAAAIKKEMDKRSKRTSIDQDWVIERLRRIADADATDFVDVTTNGVAFKDWQKLGTEKTAAISGVSESITQGGGGTQAFKMYDKVKALELLGKHCGMFRQEFNLDLFPTLEIKRYSKEEQLHLSMKGNK